MKKYISIVVATFILAACTASSVKIQPGSENIQIGNDSPGAGYSMLGPISAKHGGGCGLYGSEGDFAGALNILRNKAVEMGADYVQIIRQQGEHMSGLCLDRAYDIDGLAFRKVQE